MPSLLFVSSYLFLLALPPHWLSPLIICLVRVQISIIAEFVQLNHPKFLALHQLGSLRDGQGVDGVLEEFAMRRVYGVKVGWDPPPPPAKGSY